MTVVISDINKLKEDQHHALTTARKVRDKARKENRRLTGEEITQVERAMDEVDELGKEISLLERMEGIDPSRRLMAEAQDEADEENDVVPMDTRGSANREDREDVERDADEGELDPYNVRWDSRESTRGFRDMSVLSQREYLRHARTRAYQDAFWRYLRQKGHFRRPHLETLENVRAMGEGIDAEGGYLAPTQLVSGILYEALEYEQLKGRMDVIRANAKSITYTKGVDSVEMGWVPEFGTKPEDELTFDQFTLVPHVGAVVIWVSDELLEDESYGLQSYIQVRVAEAKVLLEEEAFISGSGSGRPWGILTRINGEASTPNRYTTTTAGAFTSEDVIGLPYELSPLKRRRGVWILGTNAIRTVRLERVDGNTGPYLWQPSLQAGEPATLDGRPVIETSAAALNSTIATGNDIGIFGDLRQYRVFERLGMQVKRLEELRALTDEVGFRFRFRTGGDVMLTNAFRSIRVG